MDCSIPPVLTQCPKCGFGYAGNDHPIDECEHWQKQKANPCANCTHGQVFHGGDASFTICVQAIAGTGSILPRFCGCREFKAES